MMRYRILVSSVVILLMLAVRMPGVALAHDGSARLELNRQQASSGAELEIRGINIAPEQPIVLALVGAGDEYPLGTAMGDEHGDFVIGVRLPAEALAGAYTVRAFGTNRVVVTAPLTLVGSANEEDGAWRDQSDVALAPLPHANVTAQPLPAVQPQQSQATIARPTEAPSAGVSPMPIAVGGLAAAVIALVLAMRRRRIRLQTGQ